MPSMQIKFQLISFYSDKFRVDYDVLLSANEYSCCIDVHRRTSTRPSTHVNGHKKIGTLRCFFQSVNSTG